MEKVIERMPNNEKVKAKRILEINPRHELFKAIEKVYQSDDTELSDYAHLLYNQALLIEGLPIKDPVDFSNKMVNLMIKSAK
jgi:molecular chaperone HtpG